MREIFFTLDEPTILMNVLINMHWSKRRKHIQALAWKVRMAKKPPKSPIRRCRIHVNRYSLGKPDRDGAKGGIKPLFDCLVVCTQVNPHGLGFILDDGPGCLIDYDVVPIRVEKRCYQRTEVTIREI